MFKYLVLLGFFALSSALTYKDCGHSEVKSLDVTGCTSTPCTFHKGKEVTVIVEFVANEDSEKAKIEVKAKIGELEVDVPGADTEACKYMSCPMKKGETKTIKYTLTVPTVVPAANIEIIAKLIGDGSKTLACGSIPVIIKD